MIDHSCHIAAKPPTNIMPAQMPDYAPKMTHNVNSRPSPHGGTGLFPECKIAPGQLAVDILEPLVVVPDDAHLKECCSWCMVWKSEDGVSSESMLNSYHAEQLLSFCTGCKVVKYCSKDCQKADWRSVHKHECNIFKNLSPRILPGSVRATIRMLFRGSTNVWDQIRRLESHEAGFKRDPERWQMVGLMAKGAHGYSQTTLSEEEVRGLYCRLMINSITLVTPTFDSIGIAFDPLASLINHSCDPNSVMTFDGRSLSVRALREIAKDEEITISYIDNTNPTHKRQEELTERYFFKCECTRCASYAESQDPREAFACPSSNCDSLFNVQLVDRSHGGDGTCNKCGATIPHQFNSQGLLAMEDQGWAAINGISTIPDDKSNNLINSLKTFHMLGVWPLQHQPLPALHQELVQNVYIPTSAWPKALMHSLMLYLLVDPVFYPQRYHPVRVVHAFTLASLFLQVSGDPASLQKAFPRAKELELDYGKIVWGLLCEVVAHVGVSHGSKSSFAETVRRKMEEVENDLRASETTRGWVRMRVGEIGLEEELGKVRSLMDGIFVDLKSNGLSRQ